MTDIETIALAASWQRHKEALRKANEVTKEAVFDALANSGISLVTVNFDGESDSGQIDDVAAYKDNQPEPIPAVAVTVQHVGWNTTEPDSVQTSLPEAIEQLCYHFLSQEQDGWENDGGANGEFTFHVPERRIELNFNARFTDYTSYSYTF
jgi:hypothetical protein